MANPRNQKSVEELRSLIDANKTFFLVDYQGLNAAELSDLRTKIRDAGGRLLVTKNTLINVVLKEQGVESFTELLNGPTALVLVGEDPVAPAKAVTDYAKKHAKDLPAPKGGMLEGSQVSADALESIAKLPSREELQSQLVGVLVAPMQQLVGVLQGAPRDLVGVLQNYADKLKENE